LHGRDLFSSKFITAQITDASGRLWLVPIKYTIGDYFLAEINHQKYCFSLDGPKSKYYDTMVRSFETVCYNTTHYRPIDGAKLSLLELITEINSLPKTNGMMFSIFKILSKKEKNPFEPHKIKDLKQYIIAKAKDQGAQEYVEQAKSIVNYLEHLEIDEIVTPVKKITEFIEGECMATDPKFLGSVADAILDADLEHKKINNVPIKSKTAWMKWIAIFSVIGLILAVVYMAYDNGAFDSIIDPIAGINISMPAPAGPGSSDLIKRYPTPEAMKCAIERGEIKLAQVPAELKGLVDKAECVAGVPQDGGTAP